MKTLTCQSCGQEHPMRDLFEISERTMCKTCRMDLMRSNPQFTPDMFRQCVDPTLCVNCGADNGDSPHDLLVQLPTCSKCLDFFRNRPFPAWIKISFAVLAVLVIFSMVWNWRFFKGHFELKAAFQSIVQGNLEECVSQITAAAGHVPESPAIRELSMYFQGLLNMKQEKWQDALNCFRSCQHIPRDFNLPLMIAKAEAGLAFDQKDYDRFLQAAETMAREQPGEAVAQAQIASALACRYAVTGDENIRRQAESKLDEAKTLGLDPIKSSHYEERIRHRLETREIIDAKEFSRRFPEGWPARKDKQK